MDEATRTSIWSTPSASPPPTARPVGLPPSASVGEQAARARFFNAAAFLLEVAAHKIEMRDAR